MRVNKKSCPSRVGGGPSAAEQDKKQTHKGTTAGRHLRKKAPDFAPCCFPIRFCIGNLRRTQHDARRQQEDEDEEEEERKEAKTKKERGIVRSFQGSKWFSWPTGGHPQPQLFRVYSQSNKSETVTCRPHPLDLNPKHQQTLNPKKFLKRIRKEDDQDTERSEDKK